MRYRENVDLASRTSWGVGGVARRLYSLEVDTVVEVPVFLNDIRSFIPILGNGTNVLVDDGEIPAVLDSSTIRGEILVDADAGLLDVPAGVAMPRVARVAARNGLAGFSFLAGIPGSIAGGVVMNAGTGGVGGPSLQDLVVGVSILDGVSGERRFVAASELDFAYRSSALKRGSALLFRVALRARTREEPIALLSQIEGVLRRRRDLQPIGQPSAGSVFLPASDGTAAAQLIDASGLKGLAFGGATVSSKHANWIISSPGCSALEVRTLIEMVGNLVWDRLGVRLEREVQYFPAEAVKLGRG